MHFETPIRFALDHCRIEKFSPAAINCNCSRNKASEQAVWYQMMKTIEPFLPYQHELSSEFKKQKASFLKKLKLLWRYAFSYPIFKLSDSYYLDKRTGVWNHKSVGDIHDLNSYKGADGIEIYRDGKTNSWKNKLGQDIWDNSCRCLENYIKKDLNILVSDRNWHHWNGGVFLFNMDSANFLDDWHDLTLRIFECSNWKTRDQGTLIATVWKHGLQRVKPLDIKWNFLADANNENIEFNEFGEGSDDGGRKFIKVEFIHVYHRFGDNTWEVWNNLLKRLNANCN
jgi:hypothetical protein